MVMTITGFRRWSGKRDNEGHREYKLTYMVEGTNPNDGPAIAIQTPGLPEPGATWFIGNDLDLWAWCRMDIEIQPMVTNEPNTAFELTYTFSSKPEKGQDVKGCSGQSIEDPLQIPQKITGGSVRYSEEFAKDKDGVLIRNKALEPITGPQAEFDRNRSQVIIEQNVLSLQLNLCNSCVNKVNSNPLWGMDKRCVKLSEFKWERKFYGSCYLYFTRTFTFDLMVKKESDLLSGGGWDHEVWSKGNYAVRGAWEEDQSKPNFGKYVIDSDVEQNRISDPTLWNTQPINFSPYKAFRGDYGPVAHDKNGFPADVKLAGTTVGSFSGSPAPLSIQVYKETDLLRLGIPSVIDQYRG